MRHERPCRAERCRCRTLGAARVWASCGFVRRPQLAARADAPRYDWVDDGWSAKEGSRVRGGVRAGEVARRSLGLWKWGGLWTVSRIWERRASW